MIKILKFETEVRLSFPRINIHIWRIGADFGWFSGCEFSILKIEIGKLWNVRLSEGFTIISIQIAKFCISLFFCEEE